MKRELSEPAITHKLYTQADYTQRSQKVGDFFWEGPDISPNLSFAKNGELVAVSPHRNVCKEADLYI